MATNNADLAVAADAPDDGNMALRNAIIRGNDERVCALLDAGVSVNGCVIDMTHLMLAMRGPNVFIVQTLVAHGADVTATNRHGYTALHHANVSSRGHLCVGYICAAAPAGLVDLVDNDGWSALDFACHYENAPLVRALLQCGAAPSLMGPREPWVQQCLDTYIADMGGIDGVARAHREWLESLPHDSVAWQRWQLAQPGRRTKAAR